MIRHRFAPLVLCAGSLALSALAPAAHAALSDEIQVYDDAINKPGEFGLELHVNTTPRGRTTPDYPGEITPQHAWRITPEFSYGLSKTWEAGLYLPTIRDANRNYSLAGVKLRIKWIPQVAPETGGYFYGANLELAHVKPQFEQATNGLELRPIVGWRDSNWLVAANPVMGYDLNKGQRGGGLDFSPAIKVARNVAEGVALGVEMYSGMGKIAHPLARNAADRMFFIALDVDKGPMPFNIGIGKGLNTVTDKWTVKAIFDIPF